MNNRFHEEVIAIARDILLRALRVLDLVEARWTTGGRVGAEPGLKAAPPVAMGSSAHPNRDAVN